MAIKPEVKLELMRLTLDFLSKNPKRDSLGNISPPLHDQITDTFKKLCESFEKESNG